MSTSHISHNEKKLQEMVNKVTQLLETARANHERASQSDITEEQRQMLVNEAQVAAKIATEIMTKYKIEQSEVDSMLGSNEKDRLDPMGEDYVDPTGYGIKTENRKRHWRLILASIVGHRFCCAVLSNNKTIISFAGRKSDRLVAVFLYVFLLRELEKHSEEYFNYMKKNGQVEEPEVEKRNLTALEALREALGLPSYIKRYRSLTPGELKKIKTSYINGWLIGLNRQMNKAQVEAVNSSNNPGQALIILNNAKNEAEDFIKQEKPNVKWRKTPPKIDVSILSAAQEGYKDGNGVDLPNSIEPGTIKSYVPLPEGK